MEKRFNTTENIRGIVNKAIDLGKKLTEPGVTILPPLTRTPSPRAGSDTHKLERQANDSPQEVNTSPEMPIFDSQAK